MHQLCRGYMNDQENIKQLRSNEKREREWVRIHKEMEAGSNGLTQEDINYFEDKTSMAQDMQVLKDKYNRLIKRLIAEYISQGLSEHDARMKAVMSDESLDMVYPNGYG